MSMSDLIPMLLATRIEKRKLTRTEIQRRWREKHRAQWNAYRREWRARKAA